MHNKNIKVKVNDKLSDYENNLITYQKIQDFYFDIDELEFLLQCNDKELIDKLRKCARLVTELVYGKDIYIRGLIECSNYCVQNCYYCGIRAGNTQITRFRLSEEQILESAKIGYEFGFRTFVIQGGEDPKITDDMMEKIIIKLKSLYPENAITLSLGIRTFDAYERFKLAGADRYLLRHESADEKEFRRLHPKEQSFEERKKNLIYLKEIGFQVGSGYLIGAPGASWETYIKDILFLRELRPQMIGIGPFLPHHQTPFAHKEKGSAYETWKHLAILRLENPRSLIPSTTALNSVQSDGRIGGILSGANVVMPNIGPKEQRKLYTLYDNKVSFGKEAGEGLEKLSTELAKYGYTMSYARGDYKL